MEGKGKDYIKESLCNGNGTLLVWGNIWTQEPSPSFSECQGILFVPTQNDAFSFLRKRSAIYDFCVHEPQGSYGNVL